MSWFETGKPQDTSFTPCVLGRIDRQEEWILHTEKKKGEELYPFTNKCPGENEGDVDRVSARQQPNSGVQEPAASTLIHSASQQRCLSHTTTHTEQLTTILTTAGSQH